MTGARTTARSSFLVPILVTVMVLFLLAIAVKLLPMIVWLGGTVIVAAVVYCYFVTRYPMAGFFLVFFVLLTFYQRLAIPIGSGAGGGGGTIALGDFLWFGCLLGFILLSFPKGIPIPAQGRFHYHFWMMVPYLGLAFILPVAGVLFYRYPATYMLSGFRQLQWASLAPMIAFLCQRYGARRVSGLILKTLLAAGIAHALYALVQFAYGLGLLSSAWIYLDTVFNNQHGTFRFSYPRASGFLVNPNALGVYSALVFGLVLAFRPQGFFLISKRFMVLVAFVAATGIILSGSRSALLGVLVLLVLFVVLSGLSSRVATGGLVGLLVLGVTVLMFFPLLENYLPEVLSQRFGRLLDIFQEGVGVDPTANARVLEWERLWEVYINDFPLGTWVPPSYALGSPVDSFFVFTAVQGTPLFTLAWLMFLGGAALQGLFVFSNDALGDLRGIGLLLFLFVGVFLGAAVGMSPMPQTQLISSFWVLVGVVYFLSYGRQGAVR